MPTCRPLGRGLYEVRSTISGKRISRVLFGFDDNEILLVQGFVKKTQKAPAAEIALARKRLGEETLRGSTFEGFLDEAGMKDEVYADAAKRVLAYQLSELMKERKIGKTKMAELMGTSRTQLDRLLDPSNDSVQLNTIQKAASILGRRVRVELIEIDEAPAAAA